MGCPPVSGYNPRALASGKLVGYLTYMWTNMSSNGRHYGYAEFLA